MRVKICIKCAVFPSSSSPIPVHVLRVASQFSGAYLGSAVEYALIDLLPKVNSCLLNSLLAHYPLNYLNILSMFY